MKHTVNFLVGTVGSFIAAVEPEKAAAVFAGVATGCWMFYQIGASISDRRARRKNESVKP